MQESSPWYMTITQLERLRQEDLQYNLNHKMNLYLKVQTKTQYGVRVQGCGGGVGEVCMCAWRGARWPVSDFHKTFSSPSINKCKMISQFPSHLKLCKAWGKPNSPHLWSPSLGECCLFPESKSQGGYLRGKEDWRRTQHEWRNPGFNS